MDNPTRWPLTARLAADYPEPYRLLRKVFPKLVYVARKLGMEWEDIDGICWLGAMHAEERFDPSLGVEFSAYAVHGMRSKLSSHVRSINTAKRSAVVSSLDVPVYDDGPTYADNTPGPDVWAEYDAANEAAEVMAVANKYLTPAVRMAVLSTFGIPERLNEVQVCERAKVSVWAVARLRQRGMQQLRRHLSRVG